MATETKNLYLKLCKLDGLVGELTYTENDWIAWRFNEHLCVKARLDSREGYIEINHGMTHYHPATDEIFDELSDILYERTIFVSKVGIFGRYISGIYPREYFEKHIRRIKYGLAVRCVTSRRII